MTSKEIRQKFLNFFEKREHTIVPSSSLVPDDPSVLLTSAGMQQFKPYYTGEIDPMTAIHPTLGKPIGSKNVVSIQKCFRTSDIDEVGDESHLTFFEMLGNFSFGGYFKKEAISYAHKFITEELGLTISYVTIFNGRDDLDISKDEESRAIWKSLGIPDEKIIEQGMDDVFWGPTGSEGPCGPTTEIYCKNAAGNDIEIWNIVFNEYFYPGSREELFSGKSAKKLEKLKTPGVDTGMGLERLAMISQNKSNIFETDIFAPFQIYLISGNLFHGSMGRVIADHLRASIFLLSDGVRPLNKEAGYILRRLLRRVIVQNKKFGFSQDLIERKIEEVINIYSQFPDYNNLKEKNILDEFRKEENKFNITLEKGLMEFYKKYPELKAKIQQKGQQYKVHHIKRISGKDAFNLYQTFGFPLDVIKDLAKDGGHIFDEEEFNQEFKKHKEISHAGAEKKFGGHGLILDTGELKAADDMELAVVTRYHTATHLLQSALRKILGENVHQMGSDITAQRMRFDFNFDRKLTAEEIQQIETTVNFAIKQHYSVEMREMQYDEAMVNSTW
ncbi:MAG: alanine--tRNA ligase-related protein [Patescibacteria group bacterium]|mgnify:FL=1